MAIRNDKLGGQDWDDERLYDYDLNDTFDAVINNSPKLKSVAKNIYSINLNSVVDNDTVVCVDLYNKEEGKNGTVNTTNTTATYTNCYVNSASGTEELIENDITIRDTDSITLYVEYSSTDASDTLTAEITDGTNTVSNINLKTNKYNVIDISSLTTSSNLKLKIKINSGDVTASNFTYKRDLSTGRYYHTSSSYNNKAYIIGGYDGSDELNSVEEYNPLTNSISTKANHPIYLMELASAECNGKIYTFGGRNGSTYYRDIFEYDISNNTWTTKSGQTKVKYSLFSACSFNNNIYIFGGNGGTDYHNGDVYEYDVTNDKTKVLGVFLYGNPITTVKDNKYIYLISTPIYDNNAKCGTIYKFDPRSRTITILGSLNRGYYSGSEHAHIINNNIYIIGGILTENATTSNFKVQVYNIKTNTSYIEYSGSFRLYNHSVDKLNDKLYTFGNGNSSNRTKIHEYTPKINSIQFYGYSIISNQ